MKLNARQLRDLDEDANQPISIKRNPLYFILDNIYDTYNIGGLFRLADALAIEKLYICGDSETPPNHKIKKASIGTYKIVPWEYKRTAVEAIEELKKFTEKDHSGNKPALSRITIVSIEQSPSSIPYTQFSYSFPLALVVGNETEGVSKEAMNASDAIVEIPMYGINKSLNVIVSAATVGYHISSLLTHSS